MPSRKSTTHFNCRKLATPMSYTTCLRLQREAIAFFGEKAELCGTCPCEQGKKIAEEKGMKLNKGQKDKPVVEPNTQEGEEIMDEKTSKPGSLEDVTVLDMLKAEKEGYVVAAMEWNRKISILNQMIEMYQGI